MVLMLRRRTSDETFLLIAATARATDRTIVTTDHEAFTDLPGVATAMHR